VWVRSNSGNEERATSTRAGSQVKVDRPTPLDFLEKRSTFRVAGWARSTTPWAFRGKKSRFLKKGVQNLTVARSKRKVEKSKSRKIASERGQGQPLGIREKKSTFRLWGWLAGLFFDFSTCAPFSFRKRGLRSNSCCCRGGKGEKAKSRKKSRASAAKGVRLGIGEEKSTFRLFDGRAFFRGRGVPKSNSRARARSQSRKVEKVASARGQGVRLGLFDFSSARLFDGWPGDFGLAPFFFGWARLCAVDAFLHLFFYFFFFLPFSLWPRAISHLEFHPSSRPCACVRSSTSSPSAPARSPASQPARSDPRSAQDPTKDPRSAPSALFQPLFATPFFSPLFRVHEMKLEAYPRKWSLQRPPPSCPAKRTSLPFSQKSGLFSDALMWKVLDQCEKEPCEKGGLRAATRKMLGRAEKGTREKGGRRAGGSAKNVKPREKGALRKGWRRAARRKW